MQQNEIVLCVKDKIPQPNSLLPNHLMKSQTAKHLLPKITDIRATSSIHWPLDQQPTIPQQHSKTILNTYYDHQLDINHLLTQKEDIVYLNTLAINQLNSNQGGGWFGSINTKSQPNTHDKVHSNSYNKFFNICELQFDDCIESGNLYFALKHDEKTFILGSRFDYNTLSYGQWFYFKLRNRTNVAGLYKFYIVNMTKNGTMFGKGLKISVCRKGIWGKQGTNISYLPNQFLRKNGYIKNNQKFTSRHYYTLCFSIRLQAQQTIYVAYNQPYTYTRLGNKLDSIESQNMNRSFICRTPLGNRIDMISFSKKSSLINKKIIFIVGRTHPIQTAGSFVIEGIIEQLAKKVLTPQIESLLQNYIINIVPMINPDGVILGNSRCNLHGFDLNRQWKNPSMNVSPEIVKLKNIILKYEGKIEMFLDIHGHSKKKNVFAYGCHDLREPYASRQFPYLLSKFSQKDFLFSECRFTRVTQKKTQKDGTARISLWKKLKIPNIFTIQNSYCCAKDSKYHYDYQCYAEIGKQILQALMIYFSHKIKGSKQNYQETQKKRNMRDQILKDLRNNEELITMGLGKQDSSQSEQEERIVSAKTQNKEFYTNKIRKKQEKVLLRSKTQKVTSMRNYPETKTRMQKKQSKLQVTVPINSSSMQAQLPHSISNAQLTRRNMNYKNLSPLTKKKEIQITKCGGLPDDRCPQISLIREKNSAKAKQKSIQNEQKTLSIIEIGKQTLDQHNNKNSIPGAYSLVQMHFHKNNNSPQKRLNEYRQLQKKKQEWMRKPQFDRKNNLLSHIVPTLKHKKVKPPSNIEEFIRKFNDFKPQNMEKEIKR